MAMEFMKPPNIARLGRDNPSSSSGMSIYTFEAHKRLANGDFGYPNGRKHASLPDTMEHHPNKTDNESDTNIKRLKPIKEFKVNRRNSIRGTNYYRLSKSYSPTSKTNKRLSKFQKPEQIDPILKTQNDIFENPNYMVSYFTKSLELLKQEPKIFHKILRAELEKKEKEIQLLSKAKSRKYHSLPSMKSQPAINNQHNYLQNQRLSAPPDFQITFKSTNLTLSDYMNTPLDFYQHQKHDSGAYSGVTTSTKYADESHNSSTGKKTKSSASGQRSVGNSIATSSLSMSRSKPIEETGNSRMLKTKRKDNILRKQSMFRDSVMDDENFRLKQQISNIKKEKYLSKYGTPILEANTIKILHATPEKKRYSDCGDVSIATGDEVYYEIRTKLLNKKPKTWKHAYKYIHKHYPEIIENQYFMARFMFEIYLRRVLAASMALKLGSDKSHRDSSSAVWLGLKESISSVYGEDNALFFESQASKNP